jgi:hypothetical protein
MSVYLETDFCDEDSGLDYVFGYMGAVYGASFNRHWEGMEPELIRQVWKKTLGRFLTYKPSLDFAFGRMSGDFPPSAIKFRELCNAGPDIPSKPVLRIEKQLTAEQKAVIEEHKAKARAFVDAHKGKHR